MDTIFGQAIIFDVTNNENKVRSNVWKIQKIALNSLKYGGINVLILFICSFHWMTFLVGVGISIVTFAFIWKSNKADSAELIAEINSIVGSNSYDRNSVDAYQKDITKDVDMIVAMRSITAVYIFGFFIIALAELFIFMSSIPFLAFQFNCLIFLLPWVYMGIIITKKAENGAREDFNMSLNGGLKKLFQTDTIRTSPSQG